MSFVKDEKKQEEMWETQHELAAHKIYNMCSDLGGFFLKVEYSCGDSYFTWHFFLFCVLRLLFKYCDDQRRFHIGVLILYVMWFGFLGCTNSRET